MSLLGKNILKTLAYADIFDCPLALEEIGRFLISPSETNLKEIKKEVFLLKKKKLIGGKTGKYFFLKGREKIVNRRQGHYQCSREKLEIGQVWAVRLKVIPWVQAVLATGALSKENASPNDDIDWLVITSCDRLWLTRLLLVLFFELFGVRRRPGQQRVKNKICLNMFLDETRLMVPVGEQNLFTAHEVLQTKLLWQRKNAYFTFIKANSWARKYLANAYVSLRNTPEVKLKVGLPYRFSSFLFDFLEKLAFRFQVIYMERKKTIEKIELDRALFHPRDTKEWVMKEYQKRLKKYDIITSR